MRIVLENRTRQEQYVKRAIEPHVVSVSCRLILLKMVDNTSVSNYRLKNFIFLENLFNKSPGTISNWFKQCKLSLLK